MSNFLLLLAFTRLLLIHYLLTSIKAMTVRVRDAQLVSMVDRSLLREILSLLVSRSQTLSRRDKGLATRDYLSACMHAKWNAAI